MTAYLLALVLAAEPATLSSEDFQQIQSVTKRVVVAMVAGDRETLRLLVPRKTENRYGTCPLTAMPRFTKVVVDKNRAGIYFTGGHNDPALPQKGLFLMVRVKEDVEWPWKVRTVIWHDRQPRSVRLPSSSTTKEDVAQEAQVRRSGLEVIRAWRKSDYPFLERMSYRWVEHAKAKSSVKLKVKGVRLTVSPAGSNEATVHFTAKLRVLGVIPYNVNGTLYAVKEDGEWKVRENSFMF